MSHSVRHTPICGNASAKSDRPYKTIWHRAWRRTNRQRVRCWREPIALHAYKPANIAKSNKDGKHWYGTMNPHAGWHLRFSPEEHMARYQQMCACMRRK